MSFIKFLFYRKKDKSILESQKYGEKQVNPEELDTSLLAYKKYPTFEEREKSMKLRKVSMLGRKEYPKVFTEAEEEENNNSL